MAQQVVVNYDPDLYYMAVIEDIAPYVNKFNQKVEKGLVPKDKRDLYKLDYSSLVDLLKSLEDKETKGEKKRRDVIEGSEVMRDDDKCTIWAVWTNEAMRQLGSHKWCIAQENSNYWPQYALEGRSFHVVVLNQDLLIVPSAEEETFAWGDDDEKYYVSLKEDAVEEDQDYYEFISGDKFCFEIMWGDELRNIWDADDEQLDSDTIADFEEAVEFDDNADWTVGETTKEEAYTAFYDKGIENLKYDIHKISPRMSDDEIDKVIRKMFEDNTFLEQWDDQIYGYNDDTPSVPVVDNETIMKYVFNLDYIEDLIINVKKDKTDIEFKKLQNWVIDSDYKPNLLTDVEIRNMTAEELVHIATKMWQERQKDVEVEDGIIRRPLTYEKKKKRRG
jgi:hypothetical protein